MKDSELSGGKACSARPVVFSVVGVPSLSVVRLPLEMLPRLYIWFESFKKKMMPDVFDDLWHPFADFSGAMDRQRQNGGIRSCGREGVRRHHLHRLPRQSEGTIKAEHLSPFCIDHGGMQR